MSEKHFGNKDEWTQEDWDAYAVAVKKMFQKSGFAENKPILSDPNLKIGLFIPCGKKPITPKEANSLLNKILKKLIKERYS